MMINSSVVSRIIRGGYVSTLSNAYFHLLGYNMVNARGMCLISLLERNEKKFEYGRIRRPADLGRFNQDTLPPRNVLLAFAYFMEKCT